MCHYDLANHTNSTKTTVTYYALKVQQEKDTATTLSTLVVVFQLILSHSRFLLGFLPLVHKQKLWQCGTSSLLVRCASCHRANSVKALQETQQHRPKPEYEVLRQGALLCYISSMKSWGKGHCSVISALRSPEARAMLCLYQLFHDNINNTTTNKIWAVECFLKSGLQGLQ